VRGGAEQTDSDDGECDGGQAATGASSETGTRRGVKQNTEADPSSMMAENSHLISKMPERKKGLPNVYLTRAENHSEIRTYLGVCPVIIVQSQLTGAI